MQPQQPTRQLEPLPEGFISELFIDLHDDIRYHLMNSLYNLQKCPSQDNIIEEKDVNESNVDPHNASHIHNLQRWIFGNIAHSENNHCSNDPDRYDILLYKLILSDLIPNLVDLSISLSWQHDLIKSSTESLGLDNAMLDRDRSVLSRVDANVTSELIQNDCQNDIINNPLFSQHLQALKHLQHLNLGGLKGFSEKSILRQIFCPHKSLDQYGTRFNNLQFNPIFIIPSLITLDLSYNNLDTSDFEHLSINISFPLLQSINISGNNLGTRSALGYLLTFISTQSTPHLKSIDLNSCGLNDNDDNILPLVESSLLSQINTISLMGNRGLTDDGLLSILKSAHFSSNANITTLNFSDISPISLSVRYLSLVPGLVNLEVLHLAHCGLYDKDVEMIACSPFLTRNLSSLSLRYNPQLTDLSLRSLAVAALSISNDNTTRGYSHGHFFNLKELDLSRNQFTSKGLVYLSRLSRYGGGNSGLYQLTDLNLSWSNFSGNEDDFEEERDEDERLLFDDDDDNNEEQGQEQEEHLDQYDNKNSTDDNTLLKDKTSLIDCDDDDINPNNSFGIFISSQMLKNLRKLNLTGTVYSFRSLCSSQQLSNLTHLRIGCMQIRILKQDLDHYNQINPNHQLGDEEFFDLVCTDRINTFLAKSQHLKNLTLLDLSMSNLSNSSLKSLSFDSPQFHNLKELYLDDNQRIDDEGIDYLCNSGYLKKIQVLSLKKTSITHQSMSILASSTFIYPLKSLILGRRNDIRQAHCDILLQSGWFNGEIKK